jgi:hypothetical protein
VDIDPILAMGFNLHVLAYDASGHWISPIVHFRSDSTSITTDDLIPLEPGATHAWSMSLPMGIFGLLKPGVYRFEFVYTSSSDDRTPKMWTGSLRTSATLTVEGQSELLPMPGGGSAMFEPTEGQ